ncbi:hypothetical protein XELAEV_18027552mg [Xenopus laevis]|uniref:Uncharacterized protein n=1 Tax=Xenopus laevis TaxID=8355 RepID=A0A974CVP4_XENLA|nr:hypothetical protein XELAEV_18027552mg [Xenopus laevis]
MKQITVMDILGVSVLCGPLYQILVWNPSSPLSFIFWILTPVILRCRVNIFTHFYFSKTMKILLYVLASHGTDDGDYPKESIIIGKSVLICLNTIYLLP